MPGFVSAEPFDAVKAFFAALSEKSPEVIVETITEDFLLLERGEVWDAAKLIEAVQGDYERRNFFALIEQSVNQDEAWVAYWNRALLTMTDGSEQELVWLESAVIRETERGWRVRMLHSTKTEPSNIPETHLLVEHRDPVR